MARRLAVVLAIALLGAPACSTGGGRDDTYHLQVDGLVEVTHDGTTSEVGKDRDVVEGDVVRMLDGDAVLELPGDRSMRLRAADEHATTVTVAAEPDLMDGDAVVIAGDDDLSFTVGDVDVLLTNGAARVQRGLSVTIALYGGTADVRAAGRSFADGLPALRQLTIPATGLLPRTASPLLYDEKNPDPWDREFLGAAIDLGADLDRRARGFTGQLGPRVPVNASLLKRVLPPLADEAELSDALVGQRSAGEALVGASIVVASGGPFSAEWDDVFSFRADGARWGLVALDQRVKRDALISTIMAAVGRSPLLFATGSSGNGSTNVAIGPTSTTTPPTSSPPTTTSPPNEDGDPTPVLPTPTIPPDLLPVPLPTIPPLPSVPNPDDPDGADTSPDPVEVVVDLIGDLLGGESPPTTLPTALP
jgi:hypothetical protein